MWDDLGMTVTFATPIEDGPCDHEYQFVSTDWTGTLSQCLYCKDVKFEKREVKMMNC